jgi:hypothetical protein
LSILEFNIAEFPFHTFNLFMYHSGYAQQGELNMKKTHKGKEIKGTSKKQQTTQKTRTNGELVRSHHKSS